MVRLGNAVGSTLTCLLVGGYGAYWPNDTTTVEWVLFLSCRALADASAALLDCHFTHMGQFAFKVVFKLKSFFSTHDRLNIMPPANMALDTLKFFDGVRFELRSGHSN
jgi:hypothetical protein